MKNTALFITFLTSSLFLGQKNLIGNGGFEEDELEWANQANFAVTPYSKHSGAKGGSITQYTTPYWKGIEQAFFIPKSAAAIEVSAWVKADGIEKGSNEWNKGVIITEIGGKTETIASLEQTTPWKEVKKVIAIGKKRDARIMIALSECTGSFYFDDIKIVTLSEEEYNKAIEEETKKHEVEVIKDSYPLEVKFK